MRYKLNVRYVKTQRKIHYSPLASMIIYPTWMSCWITISITLLSRRSVLKVTRLSATVPEKGNWRSFEENFCLSRNRDLKLPFEWTLRKLARTKFQLIPIFVWHIRTLMITVARGIKQHDCRLLRFRFFTCCVAKISKH